MLGIADRTQPDDTTGVGAGTSPFPANQYYENSVAYCSSSATTQLKPITPAGIPSALKKVERYRLLNDAVAAESI